MAWKVEILPSAENDLKALDRSVRQQVLGRLSWLAEYFESTNSHQLGGDWKGFFKLRAGDWRITYTFDSSLKLIKVHIIGHRSKIYKRRK